MAKFTSRLIISIFLLTMVGSVSAQYVYGSCTSAADGNWNVAGNWDNCGGNTPSSPINSANLFHDIIITGSEQVNTLTVFESNSLFIDCGASLAVNEGGSIFGVLTSHGTVDASLQTLFIELGGNFFNSGTFTNVVEEGGTIQQITSICPQFIGGTIVPVDKVSLLVAGTQANIQANTGWLSLAVAGIIAAGAGIALKKRSEKNNEN